jgi:hypothetical protein
MDQSGATQSGIGDEAQFHVVHAVRGRTRLRVDSPELLAKLATAIETLFREHRGFHEVRVNPDCLSVVVTYDPDAIRIEAPVSIEEPVSGSFRSRLLPALTRPWAAADDMAAYVKESGHALLADLTGRWNRYAPTWLTLPDWLPRDDGADTRGH